VELAAKKTFQKNSETPTVTTHSRKKIQKTSTNYNRKLKISETMHQHSNSSKRRNFRRTISEENIPEEFRNSNSNNTSQKEIQKLHQQQLIPERKYRKPAQTTIED
jgi:replication initiation and membrane attachment protein DnaB